MVVGGGFLGTEVAIAAHRIGRGACSARSSGTAALARDTSGDGAGGGSRTAVSHVYIEPYPLARALPAYLCKVRAPARLSLLPCTRFLLACLLLAPCTS